MKQKHTCTSHSKYHHNKKQQSERNPLCCNIQINQLIHLNFSFLDNHSRVKVTTSTARKEIINVCCIRFIPTTSLKTSFFSICGIACHTLPTVIFVAITHLVSYSFKARPRTPLNSQINFATSTSP